MQEKSFWDVVFALNQYSVFFWLFVSGSSFCFITFIFGEIFDGLDDMFHGTLEFLHLDTIFDIDVDASEGPGVFSPRVISVFVTVFGGAGLLASFYKFDPAVSSIIGLAVGAVITYPFYKFFAWIYRQQSSSVTHMNDLMGSRGRVTIDIPEGGSGQVVVDFAGLHISRAAKSKDGGEIPHNTSVTVREVIGETVIVERRKNIS